MSGPKSKNPTVERRKAWARRTGPAASRWMRLKTGALRRSAPSTFWGDDSPMPPGRGEKGIAPKGEDEGRPPGAPKFPGGVALATRCLTSEDEIDGTGESSRRDSGRVLRRSA